MLASLLCAMLASLLYLSLATSLTSAATLPDGIQKCKNDDKLNECVIKHSKSAIAALAKGDPKLGIPLLDPLFIPKIEQSQAGSRRISMNLTMENIKMTGLSKARIVKSEINLTKKIYKLTIIIDELSINSDYTLDGNFIVVPVTGKGKSTVTLYNTTYVSAVDFKLVRKKGVEYISFIAPLKLDYKPSKITLNFENLFNGDKLLGDNMNKLMNENWKDVNDQLGGGIVKGIAEVFFLVLNKVMGSIPYNQLWL